MTRELLKGQNVPWPSAGVRIEVTGASCDLSALLVGADDLVGGPEDVVFYNQPTAPGVTWTGGTVQRLDLDLTRVTGSRVLCLVSVDPDSVTLGRLPSMRAVLGDGGPEPLVAFGLTGLTTERAAVVCEVYRRAGAWKVRAVSQGYDGGLAEALTRHGVEVDADADVSASAGAAPTAAPPVPPTAPPTAPPPPPPGTSDDDRLYRQSAAIFEDAARSTAGLRSSVDFAERRREADLATALADPRQRLGLSPDGSRPGAQHGPHAEAQRRYDELVGTARASHRRDMDQLREELRLYVARLPASMAPWDSAAWRGWRPPARRSVAVHVGDLHVAEAPDVRLPMLLRVPLGTALWIDTGGDDGSGARMLRALVTRVVAAYPVGTLALTLVDLTGGAVPALAPLGRPGCSLLTEPPATTPATATQTLDGLARRVDLIQMASAAGALDAVPDVGDRLVVLHDFPFGFDDAAQARVRYLADEGPAVGLQLLLTGERSTAVDAGPLVSSVLRGALRLPVRPDDHIADGWTGTGWTYTPDLGPADAGILHSVLAQASAAR